LGFKNFKKCFKFIKLKSVKDLKISKKCVRFRNVLKMFNILKKCLKFKNVLKMFNLKNIKK